MTKLSVTKLSVTSNLFFSFLVDVNFRGAVVDADGGHVFRDESFFAVTFDQARLPRFFGSDHHDPDPDRTRARPGWF